MSKAKLVLDQDSSYLEVNGEKIENLKVTADNIKIDSYLPVQFGSFFPMNYIREPYCEIKGNFKFEFSPCSREDFKYVIKTPSAPEIAAQIEEKVVKILREGKQPTIVYLPEGYFDRLISHYSIAFVMKHTITPCKKTWRSLEVIEQGNEIKVV